MKKATSILFIFLAMFLSGCMAHFENPYFTVNPSGLNWVDIRQYGMTGRKQHVRVRIDGNGMVTVLDGTSERIGNAFASDMKNERWDDMRETRITLPEEEAVMVFQNLVNNGLFVKREKPLFNSAHATNETSFIFVSANIQNKTAGSPDPVSDPELLDALKMTIMTFYYPRPAQKRTSTIKP